MAWISDFFEKIFPTKESVGGELGTIIIDIPAELYYKELAIYAATSLISNAISHSEVKCFVNGKPIKNRDYYLLNVSPNKNETSSIFWHKVINKMIRKGKALVVDAGNYLYCADSFCVKEERPVLGDVYESVCTGNFTFNKIFSQEDTYMFQLDNVNVKNLIDGLYEEYGKVLSSAVKAFKQGNGQKYKLHIDSMKSDDEDFNKEFEGIISEQLKDYLSNETAIYPEFDGYSLTPDEYTKSSKNANDVIALKKDIFQTVANVFHIPEAMQTGNITNIKDVVSSFLSFGVDPFADCISEALNKGAGLDNYIKNNFYQVDTGKVHHRDIFDMAVGINNLISSGVMCIDEIREEIGLAPLNTKWSRKHFITKNFEEIEKYLKSMLEGGEKGETE